MPDRSSALKLRWPLVVLLASIGLTAFAAFDAQRTVFRQKEVVNRAIREFSSFAAWSYSEHLKQQLAGAAVEAVGAVNHGINTHTSPHIPLASELGYYLPSDIECDCHRTLAGPNPKAFFAFKLGTRDVDVGENFYPDPASGWRVDPKTRHAMTVRDRSWHPPPHPEAAWIADTMSVHVHRSRADDRGYGFLLARREGEVVPIIYTTMPTSWGDTMVYGAEYTPAAFQGMLTRVLDGRGLLPQTFTKGVPNRNVVALTVDDGAGSTVFESERGTASPAFTHINLPPEYGSLGVKIMMRPDQAAGLIIGGTPRSRLPFLLGLLAIATMLSMLAFVQVRRETALAGMRADFVSSISHELRTPLAQIKLYLETIRLGRVSTAEQRDWSLSHIDRETTRLGNLVENVLRFSRLGRSDGASMHPVDLAAEAERIVDEFRPLAASRKATIEIDVTEQPLVQLKPEAIRHVVVNLLDNAVKYGPISQTVRVEVGEHRGSAFIAVSDQGGGVPAKARESIWKPFAREKTSTGAAGSGIGLAIVRDVMEQNAGRAWVEDAPGGGARFVVSLPSVGVVHRQPAEMPRVKAVSAG
jgi:signal transduction histidine kinase